jgi:hypothetical protein
MEFRDRRPQGHLPRDDDFATPVSKTTLAQANDRFRHGSAFYGPIGPDSNAAAKLVRRVTKERFNVRRAGQEDFATIGDYLTYLNEVA